MRIDIGRVRLKQNRTELLSTRVTEDMRYKVEAIAQARGLSMSAFLYGVIRQITDAVGEQAIQEVELLTSTMQDLPKAGRPRKRPDPQPLPPLDAG